MTSASGLSPEDNIEASLVEMFESYRNHLSSEQLGQLEQGNAQEWGDLIGTPLFSVLK